MATDLSVQIFRGLPSGVREKIDSIYGAVVPWLPLKTRIAIQYYRSFRRFPNFSNPKTFNEKCQWFKLQHDPRVSDCVNKIAAKRIAAERIGSEHVTPTLYSGDFLPPVDQRNWPLPYVIKANHGSGLNIFVRTEAERDWPAIETRMGTWLASSRFTDISGELYYADFKPQVLVEPFIGEAGEQPVDYKVFVFDGVPRFIQLDTDRATAHKRNMYDTDWNLMPFRYGWPNDFREFPKPPLDVLLDCAAKLAKGFAFMRADFYVIGGRVIFGEMGFTPDAGFNKFDPQQWDMTFGDLWPT